MHSVGSWSNFFVMSEPESLGYATSLHEAVYRVSPSIYTVNSRDRTVSTENFLSYRPLFLWIHFYPIINRVSPQLTYHSLTPLKEAYKHSNTSRRDLHQVCHADHIEPHTRQTHSEYYCNHELIPGWLQFYLLIQNRRKEYELRLWKSVRHHGYVFDRWIESMIYTRMSSSSILETCNLSIVIQYVMKKETVLSYVQVT